MEGSKVVMLSWGAYSDYCVGGLYHAPIGFNEDKARKEYEKYLLVHGRERYDHYMRIGPRANLSFEKWCSRASSPYGYDERMKDFIIKHFNLIPIEYEEVHI